MFAVHKLRNFSVECRYRKTSLPLPRYCRFPHYRVILDLTLMLTETFILSFIYSFYFAKAATKTRKIKQQPNRISRHKGALTAAVKFSLSDLMWYRNKDKLSAWSSASILSMACPFGSRMTCIVSDEALHSTHCAWRDQLKPKVVQTVSQHVSYEFIWIRRTCDYIYSSWMFTIVCC